MPAGVFIFNFELIQHNIEHINLAVLYPILTQPTFTCSKSTVETLKQYEICSKLLI